LVGLIEGVADGLSSFAKMASGYNTDNLRRRKPVAVVGYLVTALGTAAFGLATAAWVERGVRTPVRKALLAGAVTKETYGRAFGFERMTDTLGTIVGRATAFFLFGVFNHRNRSLFAVKERERKPVPYLSFGERLRRLPPSFRKFLLAAGLFGAGDFARALLILLATQKLTPELGASKPASVAVGALWTALGTRAAFGYGALPVWRLSRCASTPVSPLST
jgi:hypothetical protein